jgi:hypothetical protein
MEHQGNVFIPRLHTVHPSGIDELGRHHLAVVMHHPGFENVLIGAGASGGVAARHLVEAGVRVVALEQGHWHDRDALPRVILSRSRDGCTATAPFPRMAKPAIWVVPRE